MADLTLWKKDGKIIVDTSGKPILCDHCPCIEGVKPPDNITVITYNVNVGGWDASDYPINCSWGNQTGSYDFTLENSYIDSNGVTHASYKHVCPDEHPEMYSILNITFTSAGKFKEYSFGTSYCSIGIDNWCFPESLSDIELEFDLCAAYSWNATPCKLKY